MDSRTPRGKSDTYRPPSYADANWLSRITMWYISPLVRMGYRRRLGEKDLPENLPSHDSQFLLEALEREWEKELRKRRPSLFMALVRFAKVEIAVCTILLLMVENVKVVLPILVAKMVEYFQGRAGDLTTTYLYASLLVVLSFLNTIAFGYSLHLAMVTSMKARASSSSLIFKKMMILSAKAVSKTTSGNILNLLSTDVEHMHKMFHVFSSFIVTPIQVAILTVLLFREFGIAYLAGLATMIMFLIWLAVLARGIGKTRLKTGYWGDKRTQLMNEIIAGMKVIKMYCWEQPFSRTIADLRKTEIRYTLRACILDTQLLSTMNMCPRIIAFFTIITSVLLNNELSLQQVLTLLAWIENMRFIVFVVFGNNLMFIAKGYYSSHRVQNFLLMDECEAGPQSQPEAVAHKSSSCTVENVDKDFCSRGCQCANGQLKLDGVTANWISKEDKVVFNLTAALEINQGQLVACVGPVGCGKTSLLLSVLNQMPEQSGSVTKNGTIAYVPQDSWVFSGTVRENILVGKPLQKERYEDVVNLCSLTEDIKQMPNADSTLVGERGVSLSGGQKARLNLARAIYRGGDIYLLDDPLSAVDTKVGQELFHNCICGYLENKTRLLVTHQLQYLKDVDRIIVMENGSITHSGTYAELSDKVDFGTLLARTERDATREEIRRSRDLESEDMRGSREAAEESTAVMSTHDVENQEEERLTGSVSLSVYTKYIKAGKGILIIPLFLLLISMDRTIYVLLDWWLTKWATWYADEYPVLYNTSTDGTDQDSLPAESRDFLHVYAILAPCFAVLSCAQALTFGVFATLAAKNLHNKMFFRVFRAPMKFFERNPVGQVLNRFARDTGFIDDLIPQRAYHTIMVSMTLLAHLIFTAVISPYAIIVTVPLAVTGICLRQYSVKSIRDAKRLEASSRSPVYSHISATLQGMSVIRAFKMEDRMTEVFATLQNRHTTDWSAFISLSRWMQIRVDWLTATYLACLVYMSLILSDDDSDDGIMIGLALIYAISMVGPLQYAVRLTAEVEIYMTSVERILQYSTLEQEAPARRDDSSVPSGWPINGAIRFDHIKLSYSKGGEAVLKDINISIQNGEKVGVVGRTGAGKSSLLTALLRLTEPTGSIWIDGIDVTTIGLDDLRNSISVIPQDPVMFGGTLRRNLDPFSLYTDEELWKALEKVELKEKVDTLPGHLYGEVTEGGDNFSVGQKQLVCLARALLKRNKILVIDEATANVDFKTDALVQQTIRTKFVDCTVLTVAHRLNTIIDSDKVLVLDHGEVKQFDHPFVLLQDTDGIFSDMVQRTGEAYAQKLAKDAEDRYQAGGRMTEKEENSN